MLDPEFELIRESLLAWSTATATRLGPLLREVEIENGRVFRWKHVSATLRLNQRPAATGSCEGGMSPNDKRRYPKERD